MLKTVISEQPLSPFRERFAVPMLLALLSLLVYANSFPGTFIQDDLFIVKNNPLVKNLDLIQIFTSDYWRGIENSGLYRPLTILSLALNRLLFGLEPWGFHLVNVLLHAGVAILLWLTLLRWGAPFLVGVASAILFAVHPIHAEVVNEAIGRSELLVGCFGLAALCFAGSEKRFSIFWVWICLVLALLAKEHAVVVLALVPLADLWQGGRRRLWQRWRLYLGMLVIVAGWLTLRSLVAGDLGLRTPPSLTAVPLAYLPWGERVLTALQFQWVYLVKLLVPLGQHAVYALADLPPVIDSFWSPRGLLVVVATLLLFVGVMIGWRRRQWWALPAVAYLLAFSPTANIVMPIGVTMAERLAYFPSLWFSAVFGWVIVAIYSHGRRWGRLVVPLFTCYLLFLAVFAGLRNRDFASEIALWQKEVLTNDTDFLAWHSYAQSLGNGQRYGEAEQAYQEMLRLQPEFQGGLRSYFTFLFQRGRYRDAIPVAEQTLVLSRRQGDKSGVAYDLVNLATAYLELRDFSQALNYLEAVDARFFQQTDIYYSFLGKARQGVGNHQAAVAAFAKISSYELDLNTPLYYGISLFSLGRLEEAKQKLEEAIRLNERAEAWNLLGTILAQQKSYDQAVEAFARAVQLAPERAHYQENLGHARALRGPSH